jgi:hypothetical protein
MSDAASTADEGVLQSVADAMTDAATTASGHAAKVRATMSDAGPRALRSLSRVSYVSAYVISYGVVYAAVFVASALPQDNAIMHGFRDGGAAARDALNRPARDTLNHPAQDGLDPG